jgi:type I restriction enzyme R subunit
MYVEDQELLKTFIMNRAIYTFGALGYKHLDAASEQEEACSVTQRLHSGSVVLLDRLCGALEQLNPWATPAQIAAASAALTRERRTLDEVEANREIWHLLRDGVRVTPAAPADGAAEEQRPPEAPQEAVLRVIDWQNPFANDLLIVSNLQVRGRYGLRSLPLVVFINGLPLVLLLLDIGELGRIYHRTLQACRHELPALFWYNALILLCNDASNRVGCVGAPWEQFCIWRHSEHEGEPEDTSLEGLLNAVCRPQHLLDLIEHFTLFRAGPRPQKIVARHHQYQSVNAVCGRLAQFLRLRCELMTDELRGRLGVCWHTQGAGKSYTLLFFMQKARRTLCYDWTFLLVTERADLAQHLYETCRQCGLLTEALPTVQASDSASLQHLLTTGRPLLFAPIQSFQSTPPRSRPLSTRANIIVIADEIYRREHEPLVRQMREALPNAAFLSFSGAPLIEPTDSEKRDTFGAYVSSYDFLQALRDGVTLPVFYENRTPALSLASSPDFIASLHELASELPLSEEEQEELIKRLPTPYSLITQPELLDEIARDLVRHFMARGYRGKALVMAFDKLTTVRLYNRVQKRWTRALKQLEESTSPEHLAYLRATEMAVVVSPSPGDEERFAAFNQRLGRVYCEEVAIRPHQQRLQQEALAHRFADPADPLRLVFVCDYWTSGLDVPCLGTLYLTRPLKGHSLIQAVTRVNRVHDPAKVCGLVVDYAANYARLCAALGTYATANQIGDAWWLSEVAGAIKEKVFLIEELSQVLQTLQIICLRQEISSERLLQASNDPRRLETVTRQAAERLLASDEACSAFCENVALARHLYLAMLPDRESERFVSRVQVFHLVASHIERARQCASVKELTAPPRGLLRETVSLAPARPEPSGQHLPLSRLDFERLSQSLRRSSTPNLKAEQLRSFLERKVRAMIERHPGRADYLTRLQRLVAVHQAGGIGPVPYAEELLAFARALAEEEERPQREGLSEEELVLFDLLTSLPDLSLSAQEREQVKEVARCLLTETRPLLVHGWSEQPDCSTQVQQILRACLAALPPAYDPQRYEQLCASLFSHLQRYGHQLSPILAS